MTSPYPPVMADDMADIVPAFRAAEDSDNQSLFAFLKITDKTGAGLSGVARLSVNAFAPFCPQKFVVIFKADLSSLPGINCFIRGTDGLSEEIFF